MADDKGKPLAAALVPSPPAHAPTDAESIPACMGCNGIHGGVGAEHHCMRREISRLRALLASLGVAVLLLVAGCGGSEFTVSDPFTPHAVDASGIGLVGADAAAPEPGSDAGELVFRDAITAPGDAAPDAPASLGTQGQNDASDMRPEASDDAGASLRDAGTSPPDVYVPPALCCATPCSGTAVADIPCGDWTCGGASCALAGTCRLGAVCSWMQGSCTGQVVACPP